MIYEIARLKIDKTKALEFEKAVEQAVPLFMSSEGCHGMALEKIIEEEGCYHLRVKWESLAHHTEIFRSSENFVKWRALVGGYFIDAPIVLHSEIVENYF